MKKILFIVLLCVASFGASELITAGSNECRAKCAREYSKCIDENTKNGISLKVSVKLCKKVLSECEYRCF